MDQQKRLFLALGLSFGLIFAYSMLFPPQPSKTPTGVETPPVAAVSADAGSPVAGAVPPSEVRPAKDGEEKPTEATAPAPPVVQAERDSTTLHRTFSSEGAGLVRAELQGPKMREQQRVSLVEGYRRLIGKAADDAPQMDMGRPVPSLPLPLSISVEGASPLSVNARYAVAEGSAQDNAIAFKGKSGVWEVEKKLEWAPDSYEHRYTVSLKNTGSTAVNSELGIHYGRSVNFNHEDAPNFFGGVGNQSRASCFVADKQHHVINPPKEAEDFKGPIAYWGIDQQYFLGMIYPLEGAKPGRCVLTVAPQGRQASAFFPLNVEPGQTVTFQFGAYIGPKDVELLSVVPSQGPTGINLVPAQLEKTVDFGIWAVICKLLLAVLKFFHGVIHNWGVAIILLTVLVKVVLLPLTHKSMVSAEQMKKLQPKMEEIKKKYPEDRERQSMEMMKLYQSEKVNPLGGCIPLLIQMPVWIALFTTLRNSFELYREPFISPLWQDLTYKDPTYLLPVALGVSMIITQKMQPQMMDAAQAKIMTYVMPVFFTAIMLNYPSGLALYILTNNVLSIIQQRGLKAYLDRGNPEKRKEKDADRKPASLEKRRLT